MSLPLIMLGFMALLALGYFSYGKWVGRHLDITDNHPTPAHRLKDGKDFVPTAPFYLFAQHFSAIAAAGPIAGPITACLMFGWLPCLLWIALGVVLIGAVHDFVTLAASVRHESTSIAEVAREQLGDGAGKAMIAFIWIALLYVIIAFTDMTAGSFVSKIEELEGVAINFNAGGAVAAASVFYIIISLTLGVVERYLKPPLWLSTVIFVPLTFFAVWCATFCSHWFVFSFNAWVIVIGVYCILASLCPVWLFLQPRGYLGGFVLYTVILIGLIGVFFGGGEIQQPAFKTFDTGGAYGTLFPFLFVTIACGACSGFHGLVCSGTTSKQIDKESHMHPVGYGAMLAEGLVAVLALGLVMLASPAETAGLRPGTIYGNGIGKFITLILRPFGGGDQLNFAKTFGAMAFSTFVFDTLDVSTRLGRYLIQELIKRRDLVGAVVGTVLTGAVPIVILLSGKEGSWVKFWTLFGASNQLLAALSLLTITLWLYRQKKRIAFTLLPMLFVLCVTFYALIKMIFQNAHETQGLDASFFNTVCCLLLVVLALGILGRALVLVYKEKQRP